MLQRSPSYVASVPERATLALKLRRFLPEKVVYRLSRTFYISSHMLFFKFCKKCPGVARKLLLKMASIQLGKRFDLAHFTPSYKPWDERMLAVPDGDLFKALREGNATVVTDQIETFTSQGIKLKSGRELSGDIIVSATGFNMQYFGGISIRVDGQPFNINQAVTYRALMLSDLPNAALIFGYTNAAWTLKADICCEYICRVLNYMDRIGMRQCTPRVPKRSFETQPFLDLTSGYVQRAAMQLPRQGTKAPWKLKQNYAYDLTILRYTRLADGHIIFSNPEHAPSEKNTQSKEQLSEGISAEAVSS